MVIDLLRVGAGGLSVDPRQSLQFDKYAQQMLENSKTVPASTPTITATLSGSDFLNQLSATLLNSIQLQSAVTQQHKKDLSAISLSPTTAAATHMDFDTVPNQVIIDSSNFSAMDELQKQLEYDKFMNEVWIGVVFTLILISMIFCICSCFLYHQFRTWKRNFNSSVSRSQNMDIESMKLNPTDIEDPVPNYTLVSGLPSYEAALELLQATGPNSCVIMYPSLFTVFNKNEKCGNNNVLDVNTATPDTTTPISTPPDQRQHQLHQQQSLKDCTKPLKLAETAVKSSQADDTCCNSCPAGNHKSSSCDSRVPSYAEATTTATTTATTATTGACVNISTSLNEKSAKSNSAAAELTPLKDVAVSKAMTPRQPRDHQKC